MDTQHKSSKISRVKTRYLNTLGKRSQKCSEVIGTIKMGSDIHFVSAGEWSSHDLLFHILKQTGPADVYFATWSMTEISIMKILKGIESGLILNIKAILDWRVMVRTPDVYELIKYNIRGFKTTTCHAKITVVQNKKWSVVFLGSANYTNNPRIEAGVISCNVETANFHIDWINNVILGNDPFKLNSK
jgi:hypothetical protein